MPQLNIIVIRSDRGVKPQRMTITTKEHSMIDPKKIEQIARQVHESMPKGLREFGDDVEKKIRQILQAQFNRMDLVNREEFDVQTQVLMRTREKLALMEQRLSALEEKLAATETTTKDAE